MDAATSSSSPSIGPSLVHSPSLESVAPSSSTSTLSSSLSSLSSSSSSLSSSLASSSLSPPVLPAYVPSLFSGSRLREVLRARLAKAGWTVGCGVKFGVDFLLYSRAADYAHAQFGVLLLALEPSHDVGDFADSPSRSSLSFQPSVCCSPSCSFSSSCSRCSAIPSPTWREIVAASRLLASVSKRLLLALPSLACSGFPVCSEGDSASSSSRRRGSAETRLAAGHPDACVCRSETQTPSTDDERLTSVAPSQPFSYVDPSEPSLAACVAHKSSSALPPSPSSSRPAPVFAPASPASSRSSSSSSSRACEEEEDGRLRERYTQEETPSRLEIVDLSGEPAEKAPKRKGPPEASEAFDAESGGDEGRRQRPGRSKRVKCKGGRAEDDETRTGENAETASARRDDGCESEKADLLLKFTLIEVATWSPHKYLRQLRQQRRRAGARNPDGALTRVNSDS
ncbi:tRNA intron endonuclease, catalytic carboxy-terminal domain protein [Toxoplasma gondii GAB2-2007-GAL-DOM2]|uniref:tRNA-intron lyase n=1 Tax=Toxoplasma gondii GAB2-2007-GAL-DOM2 TaxID=1130820 RepID=A0A086KGC0_TOXGO|nr:tRNA intron endonuclease, catalytic carboxy-terminal domain protein [Toxoplasma gondii GAB2-2007-GAL-DOM2]